MKLVNWKFNELEVPMIEINGDLYCTSKAICSALGINDTTLRECYRQHAYEIGESLATENLTLREFLVQHKTYLDIKRVRADLHIWSEKQMFLFTVFISSPASMQFRNDLWNFVKQHSTTSMVTLDMYRDLEAKNESLESKMDFMKHRLDSVEATIKAVQTPMGQIASASGKLLRMHKDVKAFRTNKAIGVA